MRITIRETKTGENRSALILPAKKKDLPLKRDKWNFNWRRLFEENPEAEFYKLTLEVDEAKNQGLLMLSLINDKMLSMENIELSPVNYGSKGAYKIVAECLIAFACLKSLELGKENYKGFLIFESKTELIELYQKKYGATLAGGQKMFIDEFTGRQLVEKYLK